jgi:hypothetical protein
MQVLDKAGEKQLETEKKKRGKWKPGESGNLTGRPSGVGEITKLRNSIAAHLPEIIAQLVVRAKAGDSQSSRLLLERVLPPVKSIEQPIELELPHDEGMTAQGVAIMKAVAAGILAPSQGAQLLTGLGSLARIKEVDQLTARITVLEGKKHGND